MKVETGHKLSALSFKLNGRLERDGEGDSRMDQKPRGTNVAFVKKTGAGFSGMMLIIVGVVWIVAA